MEGCTPNDVSAALPGHYEAGHEMLIEFQRRFFILGSFIWLSNCKMHFLKNNIYIFGGHLKKKKRTSSLALFLNTGADNTSMGEKKNHTRRLERSNWGGRGKGYWPVS